MRENTLHFILRVENEPPSKSMQPTMAIGQSPNCVIKLQQEAQRRHTCRAIAQAKDPPKPPPPPLRRSVHPHPEEVEDRKALMGRTLAQLACKGKERMQRQNKAMQMQSWMTPVRARRFHSGSCPWPKSFVFGWKDSS